VLSQHAWLLVCPNVLCSEWDQDLLPNIQGTSDPRLAGIFVAVAVLLAWLGSALGFRIGLPHTETQCHLAAALSLTVIPFVPSSNLFFTVGFMVAERVLFLPSAGFCLVVAVLCDTGAKRSRGATKLVVAVLGCLYLQRTLQRIPDWTDNEALFRADLAVSPKNPQKHHNLAVKLFHTDQFEESEAVVVKGIAANMFHPDLHRLHGRLQWKKSLADGIAGEKRKHHIARAKQSWTRCKTIDFKDRGLGSFSGITATGMECLISLARLAEVEGSYQEAAKLHSIVLGFAPDHPESSAAAARLAVAMEKG
jgi:hypothetical protein